MAWQYKVRISRQMYTYCFPTVYLFRLFGIFPFATERFGSELFFTLSLPYTAYGYILAFILIGVSFSEAVVGMIFQGGQKLDIINNTDMFVWMFTVTVYCLATFLVTFVTPKKFRQLCDYIQCFDQVSSIEMNSAKITAKADYASIILIVNTIVVVVAIICTYISATNIRSALYSILVRVVPFAFHVLVGNVVQYMIRVFVHLLSEKFVCLNKALHQHYTIIKNRNERKNKHLDAYQYENWYQIVGPGVKSEVPHKIDDGELVVLSRAYLKLMEAAKILNQHYGMVILIVLASSLFQLISTPYYIILSMQGKRRGVAETLRRLIKFSEQLLRIIILIEPLHDCTLKMKATAREVCNLLCLNERRCKRQINTLAWCVCLNQRKFSAWGCFNIDRALLSSLVGTITTYVCVLLQAQESEAD